MSSKPSFEKLISDLGLQQYYPEKLTRNDIYEVTNVSNRENEVASVNDLAWHILRKITSFNYSALSTKVEKHVSQTSDVKTEPEKDASMKGPVFAQFKTDVHKEETPHPLDVLIAIFLCCDPISRQDLVHHLWRCRLAVPLMLQTGHMHHPRIYLWALRSLTMVWGCSDISESSVSTKEMPSVAFIRFGKSNISKSALINTVMSPNKMHETFFSRDTEGSKPTRVAVEGMVEAAWFSPGKNENKDAKFRANMMFLNLRGDAEDFPIQIQTLTDIATCFVVLFKLSDDIVLVKRHAEKLLSTQKHVILVSVDINANNEDIQNFQDMYLEMQESYPKKLDFIARANKVTKEFTCILVSALQSIDDQTCTVLEKAIYQNKTADHEIDEENDECLTRKREAGKIINILQQFHPEVRKKKLLPLQGNSWRNWVEADRETISPEKRAKGESLDTYVDNLDVRKQCHREDQMHIFLGMNTDEENIMHTFVENIKTSGYLGRNYFLRWLKMGIEDFSKAEIAPLKQDFKRKMSEKEKEQDEVRQRKMNKELSELNEMISGISLGLEHFSREMGQMYEAAYVTNFKYQVSEFPKLASKILIDGYPLEIMDGEVGAVPVTWINAVLKACIFQLNKRDKRTDGRPVRVFILSVIGIQSSGKSTLMNTMFGLKFAVSSGRCTKGAFMQLVKVSCKAKSQLNADYIIIVDTEGLRSPDKISNLSHRFDNELSTLVLGVGDLTLINLLGENTIHLKDLLSVSVHAFLRMNLAASIQPKCMLVHQQLDKVNAEQLAQQQQELIAILDKSTSIACKLERVEERRFKAIIDFDITTDVEYVPHLYEGKQPMAPVLLEYSSAAISLRSAILKCAGKQTSTLDAFRFRLISLYEAMKKDSFVLEFQSTIETAAKEKLDEYWCDISWKFRREVDKVVNSAYKTMLSISLPQELKEQQARLKCDLQSKVERKHNSLLTDLIKFFNNVDPIYKDKLLQWQSETQRDLNRMRDHINMEGKSKIDLLGEQHLKLIETKILIESRGKDILLHSIKELVARQRLEAGTTLSEDELKKEFDNQWKNWIKNLQTDFMRQHRQELPEAAYDILIKLFPIRKHIIQAKMAEKSICEWDFENANEGDVLNKLKMAFRWGHGKRNSPVVRIKQTVDRFLDTFRRCPEPYSSLKLEEIIQEVKNELTQFQLSPEEEVKIVFSACGSAIKRLNKIYDAFETQRHPTRILEEQYLHFYRVFRSLFDDTNSVIYVVKECIELVKDSMFRTLPSSLEKRLMEKMRTQCQKHSSYLKSKKAFLLSVLLEISKPYSAEVDKPRLFDSIDGYVQNPEQKMRAMLSKYVDECGQLESVNSPCFKTVVDEMLQDITTVFSSAHEETKKIQKPHLTDWITQFKAANDNKLILRDIDRLSEVKVENFDLDFFQEQLCTELENIKESIYQDLHSRTDYNPLRSKIVDEFVENLVGCMQCCPFCSEVCISSRKNHGGEHETPLHRPRGVKSYRLLSTNILVQDTCNLGITSDRKFRNLDTKGVDIPYKQYKTIYPKWKITTDPLIRADGSSFWKWYFSNFMLHIAERYTAIPPQDVPRSWRRLFLQQELEILEHQIALL